MDILILLIITIYIFYRLSKNLGKIDEEEKREIHKKLLERKKQIEEILARAQSSTSQPPSQNSSGEASNNNQPQEKIIGSKSTNNDLSNLDSTTQESLSKIFSVCGITHDFFINGVKNAFEMVVNCFAKGDVETLQMLLSEKIFQGFESAINDRKASENSLTTNLISIDKVEIMSAMIIDNLASIAVKISSKQINYITDKNQNIIQGRKDEICNIIDIWTLKKDINSSNPNWKISATSN